MTVYEAATGQLIGTLMPAMSSGSQTSDNVTGVNPYPTGQILRWSPDGSRLFLFDAGLSSLTVWGPGLLPRG